MAIGLQLNPGDPPYSVVSQPTRVGLLFTIHSGLPFLTHETAQLTNGYKLVVDERLAPNATLLVRIQTSAGPYISAADHTSFQFQIEIYKSDTGDRFHPGTLISFTELSTGLGRHGGAHLSSCGAETSAHEHVLQSVFSTT